MTQEGMEREICALIGERDMLASAIAEHHAQKADDRCIEDDDRLYAAAGLPSCDRRVGDKAAMLRNCERFISRRCEGGEWPTYAQLETVVSRADKLVQCMREFPNDPGAWSEYVEALDDAVSATPTTKTHAIDSLPMFAMAPGG